LAKKLAFFPKKPQTTRTRIMGVKNYPQGQAIFVDTPGIHRPLHRMNVRMVDAAVEILPSQIRLTLGVRDVLVLQNHDDVPQIFGPTLMMPGQSFRLPFEQASEYQFTCTAHASGQMRVIVDPYPATPWARIMWRARKL